MTMKMRLPWTKRHRRRHGRHVDDPAEIFKAFVHVLARMHANARAASATPLMEKDR